jgi:hypothetical protein
MDFTKYSFIELNKIYIQLGIEYFKRIWWVILIILIIYTACCLYKNKIQKKSNM